MRNSVLTFVLIIPMAVFSLTVDYYYGQSQGLTPVSVPAQIYNVAGFVRSYCNGSTYADYYDRHYLDLEVGQTAELTFTVSTRVGGCGINIGVLPYTADAKVDGSGLQVKAPKYIYARESMINKAVNYTGAGLWSETGNSFSLTIKCTHVETNSSGGRQFTYTVADSSGRSKTCTGFVPQTPIGSTESWYMTYARAGVAVYTLPAGSGVGSTTSHDINASYSIFGNVYWTSSGNGPANDNFASAKAITGSSGSVTGSNVGAASQPGEPLVLYKSSATTTVWWKWTAPSGGVVQFDTIGAPFDTVMGVYKGSALASLTKMNEDDDGGGGQASRCSFTCVGGTTYYICVGGYDAATGSITLNWNLTASQPDLQVTALTASSPEVDVSQVLTVNYTVKNVGNAAAPSSAVYVYDGSTLVSSATKTGVLAAGGTYSGTYAFAAGSLAPGTHDIRIKADGGGTVSESNENNNTKTVSVSVRDPNAPTGVSASDGSSADGVRVSWTTASGVTSCNLYRSATTSRPTSPLRSGVTSPCDDSTATPGVKYWYWVEAIHSAGSSFGTSDTGYRAVSLSLGKVEDSYGQAGGNGSVTVSANTSWSASSDASWISFETKAGNGDSTLTYAVFANISQSARTGTVAVVVGPGTLCPVKKTIKVTQEGMSKDFTVVDGVLKSYGGSGGVVTIPSGVTSIGFGAFVDCRGLKSVIIPEGVTSIGSQAFDGCLTLTSVSIPRGLTSIGNSAFFDCPMLTSVTIPSSVMSIGRSAFFGCSSMSAITVADGNGAYVSIDGILYGRDQPTLIVCPAGKIGSVVIPSGVTNIDDSAFSGCRRLTSVTIPSGVTRIGSYVFYGCGKLTSVTLPSSVASIADDAFSGCPIAVVYVEDEPQECLKRHFGDQVWYQKIGMPINYEWACSNVDDGVLITGVRPAFGDIVVPSIFGGRAVIGVGNAAFAQCVGLKSVTMSEGLTSIGDYAFQDCSGLGMIALPSSVTSIGNGAFSGCSGLADADGFVIVRSTLFDYCGQESSVTIPSSVTSIGKSAFRWCSGLRTVTISEGLTSIGDYAFQNCSGLRTMTIPSSVTSIGNQAFYCCSGLRTIYVKPGDAERVASLYPFAANVQFVDLVPKAFSVSYEAGSHGTGMTETATKTEGEPLSLRGATFTRPGYVQTAWSKNQDGSTRDYGLGASYAIDAAITLYPYWTRDTAYELLLLPGEANGVVCISSVDCGGVHNLPPCPFTPPSGKRFAGWACSNGRRYDDGMLVFNLAKPGETVTMTAIWE